MQKIPDHISELGAHCLAKRIEKYWHELGLKDVRAWTAPIMNAGKAAGARPFLVTSNLTDCLRTQQKTENVKENAE